MRTIAFFFCGFLLFDNHDRRVFNLVASTYDDRIVVAQRAFRVMGKLVVVGVERDVERSFS